ncbi:MAG TPA: ABC transporter ATP-binding protein [Acidimicrobiales bacterium]|nr:ABC transporter ATP-binding protein [Acidimicrobiales bacterium]
MPAITLDGVGKRYRITDDDSLFVRQLAKTLTGRRAVREHWALQDIDLEVQAGESVGVIGRNGSGKTTMLRLLAGVSAPTVGRLRVEGSVAPLIGVGVGFNPELTGRENVFANGQILGLSKAQLTRDFDEIVAFAELEEFVQTPVKFYSSGMFLRLAFAVAIQVEPEVLLVDEILAVGDLAFQIKCLERMRELRERGTTIVVVTHNLGSLSLMCDRAVVLSHGRKRFDGDVDGALGAYHEAMRDDRAGPSATGGRVEAPPVAEVTVLVRDSLGQPTGQVPAGEPFELEIEAHVDQPVTDPILGFAIGSPVYGNVYMAHTLPGEVAGTFGPGRPVMATVRLQAPFLRGSYHAAASLSDPDGSTVLGTSRYADFYATTTARATGVVDLGAVLEVNGRPVADLSRRGELPEWARSLSGS